MDIWIDGWVDGWRGKLITQNNYALPKTIHPSIHPITTCRKPRLHHPSCHFLSHGSGVARTHREREWRPALLLPSRTQRCAFCCIESFLRLEALSLYCCCCCCCCWCCCFGGERSDSEHFNQTSAFCCYHNKSAEGNGVHIYIYILYMKYLYL